jgi:N-acetylmuramoyl-L-alanine amidase
MKNAMYLLQVSACINTFYILYIIFFRNSTFFSVNRFYLLVALLFSFIIPVLDFSMVAVDYHLPATDFLNTNVDTFLNDIKPQPILSMPSPGNFNFIPLIYWIGCGSIILRLIYSIVRLIRLKTKFGVSRYGSGRIVHTDLLQPFSFFNLIFLPKGEVNPLILEHEKAHVRHCHWIDLLLLEIAGAVLWFNPIMIFYKKSVKIQHEYEADYQVIRNGSDVPHYLDCILHQLQTENFGSPISRFYSQNIKKRIIMMTRKNTPLRHSLLYLLFVPSTCLLLFAFAKPSIRSITFPNPITGDQDGKVVIIVDPGHGGNDPGSTGKKGLSEKEFAIAMARNIQKAGELKNVKVILTRTDDTGMNLEERVSVAKRYNADAFISIHTNFNQENVNSSGIECVVSEKNSKFQDSKRLAEKFHREFQTLNGISLNGIKESNFYVLSENSIPAVLLELGYFSNSMDYAYLNDEKNQQQISEKIIAAVIEYTK